MNRRSFFASLGAIAVAPLLPPAKPKPRIIILRKIPDHIEISGNTFSNCQSGIFFAPEPKRSEEQKQKEKL